LIFLAILPGAVLTTFLYINDKHEKEAHRALLKAFGYGILSIIPAVAIGLPLGDHGAFFNAFISAGLLEECSKFLFLRWIFYKKPYFNEPYDGIIYAAFISLGFATLENVLYVVEGGLSVALLRMFMSVPGHAIFGVFMGYYAGLAKFNPKKERKLLLTGLGLAILTHGTYNFFLMWNDSALWFLSVFIIIAGLIYAKKAIDLHNQRSPFKGKTKKLR
ncbi:MAG: PrsW family glutamic-type intramembrane protease, partial [Flammeovirgaceae bacterium]